MKTNNTTAFNSDRLKALWAIEMREDVRRYGIHLLVGLGVILAIVLFSTYTADYEIERDFYSTYDPVQSMETVLFVLGLFIMGCLSATYIAAPLGNKATAISSLMLPASQKEKYVTRLIIFVPMFFVAYMLGITIIDVAHYIIALLHGGTQENVFLAIADEPFVGNWRESGLTYLGFFFLQSCFALGGAVWPKRGVLGTIGTGFVLGFIYSVFSTALASIFVFFSDRDLTNIFNYFDISETTITAITYAVGIIAIVFNYVLTYYRIKEAEIVNRF